MAAPFERIVQVASTLDEHTRLDTRGHTKSVAREKKDLGNERDNNKGARFLSASNCVE